MQTQPHTAKGGGKKWREVEPERNAAFKPAW